MTSFDTPKKDRMIQFSFVTQLKFPYPFIVRSIEYTAPFLQNVHYHDFPQVWYCKKGKYIHQTETSSYTCTPGTMIIISPGKYHSYEIPSDQKVELICIDIAHDAFINFCNGKFTNVIAHTALPGLAKDTFNFNDFVHLSKASKVLAENILSKLISSQPHQKKEEPVNVIKMLDAIFSLPEFKLSADQKQAAESVINSKLLPIIKSISYMNLNYPKKNISDKLATVSSLCRTNFFKYFREYLGITYSTYLIMLRVNRAAYSLVYTDYSISYISDMCGFASCSHMGIYYKKYKGILPKEDRQRGKTTRKTQPYIHVSHFSYDEPDK